MSSKPALFQPTQLGDVQLAHRVVHAPTTRFRADDAHVPLPIAAEYYAQRACVPGTLLITEATFIAQKAGGYRNVPGIWSPEQIAAWKTVTDAVHAKGSYIYLQLGALGGCAYVEHLAPGDPYISSSPRRIEYAMHIGAPPRSDAIPREMTIDEIKEYSTLFGIAASNAVHKAGFDGVEIHAANGYLIDQFLHDRSNIRTDAYGGSIENRARFALEMVDATVDAVGPTKSAIRLSPWYSKPSYEMMLDPKPTYAYVVSQLRAKHPDLSYIHVIEPSDELVATTAGERPSNDFIREIWGNRKLISAGGYSDTLGRGPQMAEEKGDLIAYGRAYISNPDLPCRIAKGIPLIKGNGAKYYIYGTADPSGYTDYPFHSDKYASMWPAVTVA